MDAQFQNSSLRTLDGSHVHFFRMIDESPGDGFNQFLHRAPLQRTFAKFQREPGNRRPGQERVHRKTSTNKTSMNDRTTKLNERLCCQRLYLATTLLEQL